MTPGPSFTMPQASGEDSSVPGLAAPSSNASTSVTEPLSSGSRLLDANIPPSGSTQPKQCARCGQQLDQVLERQPLLLSDPSAASVPSPSSFAFALHRPNHRLPPHQNLTSAINAAAAVALSRHLSSEEAFSTNQDGNPICSQCALQLADAGSATTQHNDYSPTQDVDMTESNQSRIVPDASHSLENRGLSHSLSATADPTMLSATDSSAFPPLATSESSMSMRVPSSSGLDAPSSTRGRLRSAEASSRLQHVDRSSTSQADISGLGRSGSFSRSLSYNGGGSESVASAPVVVSFPSSSSPGIATATSSSYLASAPLASSSTLAQTRSRSSSILSTGSGQLHSDIPAPAHATPGGVKQRRPSSARLSSRSGSSAGPTNVPFAAVAAHPDSATTAASLDEARFGPNAISRPRLSNVPMHVIASELHESAQNSRPLALVSSASTTPAASSAHRAIKFHADPMVMDRETARGQDPFAFSPEGLRWFDPYKPDPALDVSRLRSPPRGRGCLYPGATFNGTQKSGRNSYDVTVRIVNVDLETSHLCGYLNIRGLTEDWPELTTYFDAEIIGDRYGFVTGKWGATEADDLKHWARFPPFRPLRSALSKPGLRFNHLNKPFVFMRWKEKFLVPDHRVRDINGASFAGFYYVCVELGDSAGRPPMQSETGRGRSNSNLSSNAGSPPVASSSLFSTSPTLVPAPTAPLPSTDFLSSTAAATGQQWYAARTQRRRELSLSSPQYPINTHAHAHHFPPLHSSPPPIAGPGFWPSSPTSPITSSAMPSTTLQEDQFPPFPSIAGLEFDDLGAAGKMSGFYFHENSEPYQQLSLHHTAEPTSSSFEMR